MNNKIEFVDIAAQYKALKCEIDARIHRVLDHGKFIMGPEVRELEERLEAFTGARNCITVSSGTDALLISLMSLGVSPGDEVITTPFTFAATAEAIVLLGANPVFVDIEPDTCIIDASLLQAAITPRTKAIVPVSLYGQPADMDEINLVADRFGIPVIEDAAQSFGASYKGRKSCNLSTIGCTSFFPSKPLGCYGDGGAIFTNDDSLAKLMREIRVHGQSERYVHTRIGVAGRMDTLQCAVVLAKLDVFEVEIERRLDRAARYISALGPQLEMQLLRPQRRSVYAQFTIFLDHRDFVRSELAKLGISTAVHYPLPLHQQHAYKRFCPVQRLTQAERRSAQVLSLPLCPYLDHGNQQTICASILGLICGPR